MWIGTYILDEDGNPVPQPSILRWAHWFEHDPRRVVRQDQIQGVAVSTVFLGLDHSFPLSSLNEPHEPVLWETMIFRGEHDGYQRRYTSLKAAEAGHLEALALIESWAKDITELQRIFDVEPVWERKPR